MLASVGDYNLNGRVDAGDYVLWRKTLSTTVSTPFGGADGNGDSQVGQEDYSTWRSNFGKTLDDFGNNAATSDHISSLPSTRHGVIEVAGDVDWFAFAATAGTVYDLSTTLGSLSDSVLRLIDTDGVTQIAQNDNAIGLASHIHWTALANGTYYTAVSGLGSLAGSYDLAIEITVVATPTITSNGGLAAARVNVQEGNTAVTTVQASGGTPITYSITGGADRAKFSLGSSSGALSFVTAPNYDVPTDANSDEEYVVEVTATNAFGTDVQTITVNVTNYYFNDTQISPNQAALDAFSDYGTIGSAHFGVMTYVPLSQKWEIGDGTEPLSIFDPGANFSWVEYLTQMKNIGCKAVMVTTKHVDGFCLWPSAVTPDHSIADTPWYAANGQRNLLAEFCDTARSMGMDVGFYFSLWDGFQLAKAGGSYNGAYRTAMYGQLHELMTQFGDVKFIVLDAWGDFWGQFGAPTFGDMPRATVYNYVRSLQPNCLVGINDHEWVSGDFWIFEGQVDREPPPGITLKPVFWWAPVQATDYVWFTHSDSVVENVATDVSVNALRRDHMQQNGYVWGPNISPGPSGTLPPDLAAIVAGLALPSGNGAELSTSSLELPQAAATHAVDDANLDAPVAKAAELGRGAATGNIVSDTAPLAWIPSLDENAANASELNNVTGAIDASKKRASVTAPSFEPARKLGVDMLLLARARAFADRNTKFNLLPTTRSDDDEEAAPVDVIDNYFEILRQHKWSAVLSI